MPPDELPLTPAILRLPVAFYRARVGDIFALDYVSDGVRAVSGYSPEMLMSGEVSALGLLHADDKDAVAADVRKAIEADLPFDCQVRVRAHSGETRWLRMHGVGRRCANGTTVEIEGFVIDATEIKRVEDERDTMKMESLVLLARGIAHDFNNLIAGIRGNVDLLRMMISKDFAYRKYIDTIDLTAQRAAELMQLFQSYGGRGSLRVEPVSVSVLVADMLSMMEPTLRDAVRFERDLGADLPVIPGDATQLRQVLLNLVTNATQAMGEGGGVVRVETRRVVLTGQEAREGMIPAHPPLGAYVSLTVTDTGTGMGRTTLARMFDPFFSTRPHGKGLGLMTVLAIVRAHRGAVRVVSEPHRGTTFQVLLPCVRAASGAYRMIG